MEGSLEYGISRLYIKTNTDYQKSYLKEAFAGATVLRGVAESLLTLSIGSLIMDLQKGGKDPAFLAEIYPGRRSGARGRRRQGDIHTEVEIGAGLSDSCAGCHARPRGSAGFGGDVVTRPDSRDAPHLFGLGLKEMLADEITADLRAIRERAIVEARSNDHAVTLQLNSKGIHYGSIIVSPDGTVDTSRIEGVDKDLHIRPFSAHGGEAAGFPQFGHGRIKLSVLFNDPANLE